MASLQLSAAALQAQDFFAEDRSNDRANSHSPPVSGANPARPGQTAIAAEGCSRSEAVRKPVPT